MSGKTAKTKRQKIKINVFSRFWTKLVIVVAVVVVTLTILGTVHAANSVPKDQIATTPTVKVSTSAKKAKQQPNSPQPPPKSEVPNMAPTPQPMANQTYDVKSTTKQVEHTSSPSKTPVAPASTQPAPPPAATDIAPESVCPGQNDTASYQSALVCMTSYARSANGLAGIIGSSTLAVSANKKAQDLIDCSFSHTACGRPFNYWMVPSGYSCGTASENIAAGQPTPRSVFVGWMNSAGHKANILSTTMKSVGFGLQSSPGSQYGKYWVMQAGAC